MQAKKLSLEHFSNICRGHDFFLLMQYMINNAGIWGEKVIFVNLCECYPVDHYSNLDLYKNIESWQNQYGYSILK